MQPIGVDRQHADHRIDRCPNRDLLRLGGGKDGRYGIGDHYRHFDRLDVQPQLASDDARDVEDILHNLGERRAAPLDDLEGSRLLLAVQHSAPKHPRVTQNCVERRPQLVRECREKTVLHAIGTLGLLECARVVNRERGAPRDVLGNSQIPCTVPAARLSRNEAERPQGAPMREKRHNHER